MAILFIDGMGHLGSTNNADVTTHVGRKWGSSANVVKLRTDEGRYGGKSIYPETTADATNRTNSNFQRNFGGNKTTLAFGCGIKWKNGATASTAGSDNAKIIKLLDSAGAVQLSILAKDAGDFSTLEIYRGDGTTLLQSYETGQTTSMFYLEVKVVINNSTGSIILKVNGTQIGSTFSGDTQETANANVREIVFSTGNPTGTVLVAGGIYREYYVCDYYDADDFVTNAHTSTVKTLFPVTGTPTYDAWGKSTGSDGYALVDEGPSNDDTDYIFGNSVGDRQSFALDNLPTSPGSNDIKDSIHVVATNSVVKDSDATAVLQHSLYSNGFDNDGASFNPTASYKHFQTLWSQEPGNSEPWSITNVNAMHPGIEWDS